MKKPRAGTPRASALAGIPADYPVLLQSIKHRIRAAQLRAAHAANAELIHLYWDIGRAIAERQQREGWGAGVIPRLARDLRNELPEVKGFSERNIGRMIAFYRAYSDTPDFLPPPVARLPGPEAMGTSHAAEAILPQAVAKLPKPQRPASAELIVPQPAAQLARLEKVPPAVAQLPAAEAVPSSGLLPSVFQPIGQPPVAQLPWAHNVILMQKVKDLPTRLWYMRQVLAQGWSRNVLALQIARRAHLRQGKAVTNFAATLPAPQSDLAAETLKDPYIFDFLTLAGAFHERELETGLLAQVQKFLLELGQGFAFVGRQFHLAVNQDDFYLDLLFYHLRLRCFVVIDLKTGPFRPEYAGKMNFYCNLVDARLRHATDQPTIGLILCQERNRLVAEYALQGVAKAIGVSQYRLTRSLPKKLRSSLPTIEQIETQLSPAAQGAMGRRSRRSATRQRASDEAR